MSGLVDWNDEHGHLFVMTHFKVQACWWCGKGLEVAKRQCRGGKP